jgi:hypothetical protein
MKLYMDGYNIDVQSCREKIALFLGLTKEVFSTWIAKFM